jgi:hypothetical protein
MDIDRHGLCHRRQIGLIAIGSGHRPVGTFPPDVQLPSDFFPHNADVKSAIDGHGKILSVDLSEDGLRGLGIAEIDVSCEIF